jgi:phosphoribosylaminoimidazolecarboxamide formyltransferase/IMP cyclohydrolase
MASKRIKSALISVFEKEGLDPVLSLLDTLQIRLYSTGGTEKYIREKGYEVETIENLTGYPSILDGRVKTLHPKVFGGILARREEGHLAQLDQYDIPEIDLVIVDLYPFEKTVDRTNSESEIIEKIDIGGIALIRAAAKNYGDVLIISSREDYQPLMELLQEKGGATDPEDRKRFAARAFAVSSHYDTAIFQYFNRDARLPYFKESQLQSRELRYGENPHQAAVYHGELEKQFDILSGKALSYNNLVDVDAAVSLMAEFWEEEPTVAILKHTNPCGLATRSGIRQAWDAALACDPVSAFGGILIANRPIDLPTAQEIDKIFYEVLIAPDFSDEALEVLKKKSKRILLKIRDRSVPKRSFRRLLQGVIEQETDLAMEAVEQFEQATDQAPRADQMEDLLFANKCVKHLKSNAIALVKNKQMVGMGCGQTSRIDALKQAIRKAEAFDFSLQGAVMASDAFFPFADSVEVAHRAGITAVIQPGGSIRDKDSVAYCNENGLAMVMTGVRHFRH